MSPKFKISIFFDLDGTLVDSLEQIYRSCVQVRRQFQLRLMNKREVEKLIGLPAELLFAELTDALKVEAVEYFRSILEKEIEEANNLFAGTIDLMKKIQLQKWGIGVATSKPHNLAKLVVTHSDLKNYVNHTQGVDGFPGKPDPTVIERCKENLPASRYIMVGDRLEDMYAGKAANCLTVGISQSSFSTRDLLEAGADFCFSSISMFEDNFLDFISKVNYEN